MKDKNLEDEILRAKEHLKRCRNREYDEDDINDVEDITDEMVERTINILRKVWSKFNNELSFPRIHYLDSCIEIDFEHPLKRDRRYLILQICFWSNDNILIYYTKKYNISCHPIMFYCKEEDLIYNLGILFLDEKRKLKKLVYTQKYF